MRKCLFLRSNCQKTSMEGGHVTFSFSSIEFRYESMSDIMPFFIFQRSFSAQWMIVEGSRPVSLVMCWISGSEKKQAGALGSMVHLRQAWMGWEKRGIIHSMLGAKEFIRLCLEKRALLCFVM